MIAIILTVVAVALLVLVVALIVPARIASRGHTHSHSTVDDESEAFREHHPGGNTGGI